MQRTVMSTRNVVRRTVGLAALAMVVTATAACSGAPAPAAPSGSATVTVTETKPASGTKSGSTSPTSKPASTACKRSSVKLSVKQAAGGASAGHVQYNFVATNSGSAMCTLEGYPGVSLTQVDTGKQLGAPADRTPGTAALIKLEPGKSATAAIQVAQAGNFGSACQVQKAAGFRIYLPGETAADFLPIEIQACTPESIHQLTVKPFAS